jgi:acetoin utilization deacetylase AcuC-like enzyme
MRAFAHDLYTYPLPPGHRFPLGKYRLVRQSAEALPALDVHDTRAASPQELAGGHETDYLARVDAGTLTRRETLALGLPWSPELVERARRSVGATILAAGAALEDGRAANLGGGTHHAFPAAGRGYCVFNDVVCATRALRAANRMRRVVVIDLDVHQGDGTNTAFAADTEAFTLSINGFGNYPFQRVPGDLDLDLADGTGDEPYLEAVARLVPKAVERARPELCFYLAGADPYAGDRLGRLRLSMAGLAERDRVVRDVLESAGVPVCLTLAGGYAEPIEDTVRIHLATLAVFAGERLDG